MSYIIIAIGPDGLYTQVEKTFFHTHAAATGYAESSIPEHTEPTVVWVRDPPTRGIPGERPSVRFLDGTTASIQASSSHHCKPRNDLGPYSHVEVSRLTSPPPRHWSQWRGGPETEEGMYLQVPAAEVLGLIHDHGGLMEGELPPLKTDQGW